MSQAPTAALKSFARRHHLLFNTDETHDDAVAVESVFRHRDARDTASAIGAVHNLDLIAVQRRIPAPSNQSEHTHALLTILSTGLDVADENSPQQLLFLHADAPEWYSLTVKHLRRHWHHQHLSHGYLFMPAHSHPVTDELSRYIDDADTTVEVNRGKLSLVAAPALTADENLELLLKKLLVLRGMLNS